MLAAALATGCAPLAILESPQVPRRTASDSIDLRSPGVETRVGETFEVRLPSNPSTGYRWTLVDPVPPVVRAAGVARQESSGTGLAGAPVQETWRFEGAGPGSGLLQFEYRRPFDRPEVPPAQRAAFRVQVR